MRRAFAFRPLRVVGIPVAFAKLRLSFVDGLWRLQTGVLLRLAIMHFPFFCGNVN